uniref:Retrotransposon gag domain-containing protein n=1 Tax=Ananas comosus var. bracteatus TaxID=296719 RepID=A0A6V7NGX8_ANACO|nr:unnamed protein product [Ananas comosus var. bracteatus]
MEEAETKMSAEALRKKEEKERARMMKKVGQESRCSDHNSFSPLIPLNSPQLELYNLPWNRDWKPPSSSPSSSPQRILIIGGLQLVRDFTNWYQSTRSLGQGDEPREWSSKCEQYYKIYQIHEPQWVEIATMHFTGKAHKWKEGYLIDKPDISWKELVEIVCKRFEGLDMGRIIREFNKLV